MNMSLYIIPAVVLPIAGVTGTIAWMYRYRAWLRQRFNHYFNRTVQPTLPFSNLQLQTIELTQIPLPETKTVVDEEVKPPIETALQPIEIHMIEVHAMEARMVESHIMESHMIEVHCMEGKVQPVDISPTPPNTPTHTPTPTISTSSPPLPGTFVTEIVTPPVFPSHVEKDDANQVEITIHPTRTRKQSWLGYIQSALS